MELFTSFSLWMLMCVIRRVAAQGAFPDLFNAGESRPISSVPAVGTCGYNPSTGALERSGFCRSSTVSSSVSSCTIAFCNQACPSRTSTPTGIDLLSAGVCVTEDLASTRPNSAVTDPSFIFRNNQNCYTSPAVPTVGNDGRFTLAAWIRLDVTTDGTIVERRTQSGNSIIYAVVVSTSGVTFDYRTSDGAKFLQISSSLPISQWHHIAVQVFGTKASFFINGLEVDGTPFETQTLHGQILDDSSAQTRVGQRISGSDQFVGRMQDLSFYQETLTNRELVELATGSFPGSLPEVHAQTDCRCPDSHPRINPLDEKFCLKNGEPDTSSDQENRLGQDSHPLQYANDGDLSSYWVSTLTGLGVTNITVDIDLGQREYQVFYVVMQFYSPQPTSLTILRRSNTSDAWEPWQYYAENCQNAFGLDNNGDLDTPTSVNCIQFPSNIPYSKGNITFQLLSPEPVARPGYNDFYNTPALLQFVRATQVRVVMEGHYHTSQARHMYFGIEELTISARCDCNGHAETCDTSMDPYICNCQSSSFTTGIDCGECLPLYNDKPFRHGDQINGYNCKLCQCHGHASSCVYNQSLDDFPNDHNRGGGGVCVDCQDNTQGRSCDECLSGFFRLDGVSLDSPDLCRPCGCFVNGTAGGDPTCEEVNGQCNCKARTIGRSCDTCQDGFFNLRASNIDGCEACGCTTAGTVNGDTTCHQETGVCNCKDNVIGDKCERCNYGYYQLSASNPLGCLSCDCNLNGSVSQYCDPGSGLCQCHASTQGRACQECRDEFYGLGPGGCSPCDCDAAGTEPGSACDKQTGQCVCKANVQGMRCDQCAADSYNLQSSSIQGCTPCSCNTDGTVGASTSCNSTDGQCECKANVLGRTCNLCAPHTYGLSAANDAGCSSCGCDATGTQASSSGDVLVCDQNSGACTCLANRVGRTCDQCDQDFYLAPNSGMGCLSCDCQPMGVEPNTSCDSETGQCRCRSGNSGVTGRRCDSCLPEFFNFDSTTGMCEACDCDPRGSLNTTCEANTGQCECKELVTGRRCDTCRVLSSNLQASNPQGCSKAPAQQPPPTWQAINPFSILLTWGPPDEPNGNIIRYLLYRNDTLVYNGSAPNPLGIQQYEDRPLTPFTTYSYYVQAENEAGRAASPAVIAQTPDAIPAEFDVLTVTNIQARSADFAWARPANISADVTQYILTSVTPSLPDPPTQHYIGLATSYRATDLIPFTNYTFYLTVCTSGSCGQGRPTLAYTPQAPPQGLAAPNPTALSASSVYITWNHPLEANGIITHYELFFRGYPGPDGTIDPPETRIFYPAGWYNPRPVLTPLEDPALPPETNFTHTGLDPFTRYQYRVTARNLAGTGQSGYTTVRTAEAAPLTMPAPSIVGVSSTELNISWPQPLDSEIRGVVTRYRLYQYITINDPFAPPEIQQLIYSGGGDVRSYLLGGLQPYSSHEFSVEACNSIGCVTSDRASGLTLPSVPAGQGPPLVDGYNSSTMLVIWDPPLLQNGPDPSYQVLRVVTALSGTPPRVERGARFTGAGYYLFSGTILPYSAYTGIELEFRITRPSDAPSPVSALLMFAASDGEQEEIIAIQLREGRPWFIFDPQEGVAGATPINDGGRTYDDGLWHKVVVSRAGTVGSITVDDVYTGTVTAPTSSTIIGQTTGLYVGGLPMTFDLRRTETGDLAIIRDNLVGCMRNIRIERTHLPTPIWEDLDYSDAIETEQVPGGWQGCPTELERGVHFLGQGHLALPEGTFSGGSSFTLSLELRTDFQSGLVLFAYHQAGRYLLIQMAGGNLQVVISVGTGSPVTLTLPGAPLCDGLWKTLSITKVDTLLSAAVNGGASSGLQLPSASLTLQSGLFLGGVPLDSEASDVLALIGSTLQGFGGCMRGLSVNNALVDMTLDPSSVLNVHLDGCPPVVASADQCLDPRPEAVYAGDDRSFLDYPLRVFTEYLYGVMASNAAGSTNGTWAAGRTREGAPTGVSPPIDPVSITGYIVQLQWQRPTGNTGLLTRYVLSAYNQDLPDISSVQAEVTDTSQAENSGNITDVIPYTNYAVTVTACTAGGCTESTAVNIRTREEAPSGVQAPEALSTTARTITAGWAMPDRPNGVIVSYQLKLNGVTVYTGVVRNYTLTGLNVFSAYSLVVTACTQIGCSDSPAATVITSQLPPTSVDPPTLFPRGPRTMEARWTTPSQPNGVLERYVLYSSTVSGVVGEAIYNTSDLFMDFILTDLTPGTLYYLSVAACTGGGCTLSSQSSARTEESIPEGVPAPTITATSPYELYVSWTHPAEPNGIILSYALVQDGIVVQNVSSMSYTASNLSPWSLHVFRVEACTSKGCTFGPEASGRTREAPPQGSIDLTVFTMDSRSVRAMWTSPAQPNGRLVYEALVTGLFYVAPEVNNYATVTETRALYNGTMSNEIVDVPGLIPYSAYSMQVRASNSEGSILSNQRQFTMPAGNPDGVLAPTLLATGPTSIQASWTEPARNNAPGDPSFMLRYRPADQPGNQIDVFQASVRVFTYTLVGLLPFTEYEFQLIAINNAGSTSSEWAAVFTREAVPGAIDPPMATDILAYSALVTWEYPDRPNGLLTSINLYQNGALAVTLPGNVTQHRLTDLTPFSDYVFRVEMCNSAGCTTSPDSITYTTPQAAPTGQAAPTLSSPTPTSVQISWSPPSQPNGVLIGYEIERRHLGFTAVSSVVSVGASATRLYLDLSPAITPYTAYEYRIKVSNTVGTSSGPWASVTTKEAPPGGVRAPAVTVLGPDSVQVSWEEPAFSNGEIQSYTIRMPDPRIFLTQTNLTSYVVQNLVPYTDYSVTIEACTGGGCTESDPTPVRTDSTLPFGLAPPRGDPITQTYMSVIWSPPTRPNGPNIRYELHRQKIRQPLSTGPVQGLDFWEFIYAGQATTHQDFGLTTFTTYIYRVTVYNDIGSETSDPSSEVTTLAGQPTVPGTITAAAVDHISIMLNWTTPSLLELQGSVVRYYIQVNTSAAERYELTYDPGVSGAILTSLMPNTGYEFRQVIYNGAFNVTSLPAVTQTLDGAPEGFAAPQFSILSSSAVQVMWLPPTQPNGDITGYNIYLDGQVRGSAGVDQLSYILSGLEPYTVYSIQVEVCTVYDCLLSNATIVTTQEIPPAGVAPPSLRVLGPRAMEVSWASPSSPNGIILGYEIQRREYQPCSDSGGDTSDPSDNSCGYVECRQSESICGNQCFSGLQACCDGVLHDSMSGYECCDTNYLPAPVNASDPYVCCGGQFHTQQTDYECCSGQYVRVQPGQICCPDPSQDRVAVGAGDECCGGVPYDSSGPQICCAGIVMQGQFADGMSGQCCGGMVVPASQTCCSEGEFGTAYSPVEGSVCCGTEYVNASTSLCCVSESGAADSYMYESPEAKQLANDQCCGAQRIAPSQACCNEVGYSPGTRICADRSSTGDGHCGIGTVCPISQAVSAYCDRCDFDANTHTCHSVDASFITATPGGSGSSVVIETYCPTALVSIFTSGANVYTYLDQDLSPYTQYEYLVSAFNAAGNSNSGLANATTDEDTPAGVQPPEWTVENGVLDTIQLTWTLPSEPNGVIVTYILRRDGIEIYRGADTSHSDNTGIQPYQHYTYILSACTRVGCVSSQPVVAATLQAAPENLFDPVLTVVSSSSIRISWQEPGLPNGVIQGYSILLAGAGSTIYQGGPEDFQFTHTGLEPYTMYEYILQACTSAGCSESNAVSATTLQAPPEDLQSATHVVVSSSILEIYWFEPSKPNGIISSYLLYRNSVKVQTGNGSVLTYIDVGLTPNTRYEYVVSAFTVAGGTNSSVHVAQTPTSTPEGIPLPTLNVLSATAIRASWTSPAFPNGVIRQYGIVLLSGTLSESTTLVSPSDTTTNITNLTPYTMYDMRVQACNDGGCGVGPRAYARTYEAPPEDQVPPTLVSTGPTVVEVSWDPPASPNGIILRYSVYRRQLGTTQELLVFLTETEMTFVNAGGGLTPFTAFEYKIRAQNSQGLTDSPWASVTTQESLPVGIATPSLSAVSPYAVQASWAAPTTPNGIIAYYRIEYQERPNDPTATPPIVTAATVEGTVLQTTFYGLLPYTSYQVRIVAINGAGETSGAWASVTTLEGVPGDIGQFSVEEQLDGLALLLKWNEPGQPNGIIDNYFIYEDEYLITPIYTGLTREYLFRRLTPFTEYVVVLEACTDVGCGRGNPQTVRTAEIAPANQAPPLLGFVNSTSVVLNWRPPVNPNGIISQYDVIRRSARPTSSDRRRRNVEETAFTVTIVIHSEYNTDADDFTYTDSSLQPFTIYEYLIRAINTQGTVDSDWLQVETDQAAPVGVAPPTVNHITNTPGSLVIGWGAPTESNGVITAYRLQRNDSTPFSFAPDYGFQFTDTNLQAYTAYIYTITVCTQGGCTTSDATYIRTLETAPTFVDPPRPFAISSTQIMVNWTTPSIASGEIMQYRLKVDNEVRYSGLGLFTTISGLIPYQEYSFVLEACTSGGCTDSLEALARPLEAPPTGMNAPTLRVLSATAIEASWTEPDEPNGLISRYELRRDGKLVYDGDAQRYQDFGDGGQGLTPGQQYSYVITAFNSRGHAISSPAVITTSSSSPAGLSPPILTVLSSQTIRAIWQPPAFPNGEIQNYTLYVENAVVYSGRLFSFDIGNLDYYTLYEIRIEACTTSGCALSDSVEDRTLEHAPSDQVAPTLEPLSDNLGVASGIRAVWNEPDNPNGIILGYELFRRSVDRLTGSRSDPAQVANTTLRSYIDMDPALVPDESYEYLVTSRNSVGETSSPWASVRMLEAPPQGLLPPSISDIEATRLTVTIQEPSQPNGAIMRYIIYRNNTQLIQTTQTSYDDTDLLPFTAYSYSVEACTSGGCTTSDAVTVTTLQMAPGGLAAPMVLEADATWIHVSWGYPVDTNGIITSFELQFRPGCPLTAQPVSLPCPAEEYTPINKNLELTHNVTGLDPYTNYDFAVVAYNDVGMVESSATQQETLSALPVYITSNKPSITSDANSSLITVSWPESFSLNSQLRQYVLVENGDQVYSGIATTITRPLKDMQYEYTVTCDTATGSASSPTLIFQPPTVGGPSNEAQTSWYSSTWFIAVMVLVGVVILFIVLAVLLSRSGTPRPYERERTPLPPRQKKAHNFTFSSMLPRYPESESILDPIPRAISRQSSMHSLHNTYYNPAFPAPSPPRPTSRTSEIMDKNSLKYLDQEEGVVAWDNTAPIPPKMDSGMVSLFDDDAMTHVSQPYSYTKEQTMFTDTHL